MALPGLGNMRFSLSAKTVDDVNEVKTSLIRTRRIVFTPAQEVKDELRNTSVIITCYDREGNEIKRVTSADEGIVEDGGDNGQQNGGTNEGGSDGNEGNNGGSTGNEGGDNGGNSGGGTDPVNPDPGTGGGGGGADPNDPTNDED